MEREEEGKEGNRKEREEKEKIEFRRKDITCTSWLLIETDLDRNKNIMSWL